ncbi:MAG: AMP-binding protein [Oscillospiraceae bacterium]|jgi:acyl-CoA synthetase (AMP-forming)/AMP-acid ligase II|nr:AMP-binding protein [Oscillospiraceae bacterium]
MLITDILIRNAALFPDDTALVELNPELREKEAPNWREFELVEPDSFHPAYRKELNWFDFNARANQVANLLRSNDYRKGDKVAILLMNCLEWLPIYFGVLKAGCVAVPINFRNSTDEIAYCLELADVSGLLFGPHFTQRLVPIADKLPRNAFFVGDEDAPEFAEDYYAAVALQSDILERAELTSDDEAAIYFSSGTTGFPKAILHLHRALYFSAVVEQAHHRQTRDDVFLCIPPLYHTGAKMHWFGSLLSASKAVILRGTKPEWILEAASSERASIVWLLVPWAQDILDAIDSGAVDITKLSLERWRLMHIGAQPVPRSLVKRWLTVFPHHDYDTNYGLSESIGPGCVHLGLGNIHKVGAIGRPGFGWETKITDEAGNTLPSGQVGELQVKGDGVMRCYYRDSEASDAVLPGDGWLRTGDMAEIDDDGFIWLVDRKKDVIITGGENLYPVQIEDFLRANDKIKDVAVIGIADPRLGEIAAAIIELKPGQTVADGEIEEFCLGLPRYKRPHKFLFSEVPRNATGKIEKPKLRALYNSTNLVEQTILG